jgi:hypothetical protein
MRQSDSLQIRMDILRSMLREIEVQQGEWENWSWEYERAGNAVPMFVVRGAAKADRVWSLIQQNFRVLSREFSSVNSQIKWFERLCRHLQEMEQLRDEAVVVS